MDDYGVYMTFCSITVALAALIIIGAIICLAAVRTGDDDDFIERGNDYYN